MIEWYSVKDQLPADNERVLAIHAAGSFGPSIITLYWNRNTGWFNPDLKVANQLVITYWAHLLDVPDDWRK